MASACSRCAIASPKEPVVAGVVVGVVTEIGVKGVMTGVVLVGAPSVTPSSLPTVIWRNVTT